MWHLLYMQLRCKWIHARSVYYFIFCHASDSNKNLKFDGATIINEKLLTELLPT